MVLNGFLKIYEYKFLDSLLSFSQLSVLDGHLSYNIFVWISAAYQVGWRSKVLNKAGENGRVLCGVF